MEPTGELGLSILIWLAYLGIALFVIMLLCFLLYYFAMLHLKFSFVGRRLKISVKIFELLE